MEQRETEGQESVEKRPVIGKKERAGSAKSNPESKQLQTRFTLRKKKM